MKLEEIRTELLHVRSVIDQLLTLDGELDEKTSDCIQTLLQKQEETEEAQSQKLETIIKLCKYWEDWAKIRKEEAERIAALSQADANRAKGLRYIILEHLRSLEIKRCRTVSYNLTVANNGGKQKLKYRDDFSPLDLPSHLRKVSVTADDDAVRKLLESGQQLDFAYLEPRGVHLLIR